MPHQLEQLLQKLIDHIRNPSAEDSTGLGIDISSAIEEIGTFRLQDSQNERDRLIYQLEWRGSGTSQADLDRDFFALFGTFAMESNVICRSIQPDAVLYESIISNGDVTTAYR